MAARARTVAPVSRDSRLKIALVLNLAIVVVQVVFGFAANSLSLIADAGHNVSDVAAIIVSLVAVRWARRPPNPSRSFGYHRGTILAAQLNAAIIIAASAVIIYEAIRHLLEPEPVAGGVVLAVALVAFVANAVAAFLLADGSHDLNMRSALLHMAGDAAASLGVAFAGLIILVTGGAYWLDPLVSIVIALFISFEALRLLKSTADVLLESTPAGLDVEELASEIRAVPGVEDVHDLHVWGLTAEMRMMTAHVLVAGHPTLEEAQGVGVEVKRRVAATHDIRHATLELECEGCVDDGSWCAMDEPLHPTAPRDAH